MGTQPNEGITEYVGKDHSKKLQSNGNTIPALKQF
jgi:hypothetical protein